MCKSAQYMTRPMLLSNKYMLPPFLPPSGSSIIHGLKNIIFIYTKLQTCLPSTSFQALQGLLEVSYAKSHWAPYVVGSLTTTSQTQSHSHITHLCRPCSSGCHKEPQAARGYKQGSLWTSENPTEKQTKNQHRLLIVHSPWHQLLIYNLQVTRRSNAL